MNTKNLLLRTIVPRSGSSYTLNKDANGEIVANHSENNLTIPVPETFNNHITIKIPDYPGDTEEHEHHLYTHHQVSRLIDK